MDARTEPRGLPARTSRPLDLKGLVDAFLRRWRLFLAVVIGSMLLAATVSLILRPMFEATANIRVDPVQKSAIDVNAIARGDPPDQSFVDSEVKLMQSRDVIRAVVRDMNLMADPEFNGALRGHLSLFGSPSPASSEEAVIDAVSRRLSVSREGSTYIIDLRFKSHNPAKAANLVNAIADAYLRSSIQGRIQAAMDQSAGLAARLNALDNEVKQADVAVASYKAANGIVSASTGGTITEQQINTVTGELAAAESSAAAARSNYEAAKQQIAQGGIDSISSVMNSPTIISLRRERADLQQVQADVNSRYGPKHPETIKVAEQAAGLDRQIREESQRIVAGLESDARAAEARAASLRADLNNLKGEQAVNSRASVVADSMEREADAKRTTYNQLAASVQQVQQQEHSDQAQARIVTRATPPIKATFPNKPLFVAMGAALGLTFGGGAIFVAEFVDSGLRLISEVEEDLGVSFIASIPLLSSRALRIEGRSLVPWDYVMARPMSGYAESMRTIRSALNLSVTDRQCKVVVVTSALPNEGKTACSVALARTMAMSGERVLLIDCDLRRNSLEGLVTEPPRAGLIEVLANTAPVDAALVADKVEGLDILGVYKATFTPRDLFGADRMKSLLAELRQRYDHVVLDSPPLLAVSDARTLAAASDGVLMVARWNHTPRGAIKSALDMLERDQAPLVGLAFSMVDTRARLSMGNSDPNHYYDQIRHYYQE